jgi:peptidoglycan/LPS O-acetylase OafA/YrhL
VPGLEQADVDKANLAASVLPFALILLYLVQNQVRRPWLMRLSTVLGKMAYPMFLLHWAVCVVVSAWLFHGLASADMHGPLQGAEYFGAMFAGVLACSFVFYVCIDQPVERYRRMVRARGSAATGSLLAA